jgi:hypothetical protein
VAAVAFNSTGALATPSLKELTDALPSLSSKRYLLAIEVQRSAWAPSLTDPRVVRLLSTLIRYVLNEEFDALTATRFFALSKLRAKGTGLFAASGDLVAVLNSGRGGSK